MDYNYREAVKEAVENYLEDVDLSQYENMNEAFDDLYDEMFCADSVTGNGSGSYFFSTYKAEEALCHNWGLLGEALGEFGCDIDYLTKGAEACDVTIRCYLLSDILWDALQNKEW